MKKILICFGTRPECIKLAPLIHKLQVEKLQVVICVTGQHKEMLKQVLTFFEIRVDYDLDLMRPNQSLNSLSAAILKSVDKILNLEQPNMVLVHGDTTTSSMCALAAYHRNIKVLHIEAGLRTYNKLAPFPEEINRQLTARIADFNYAPTQQAFLNLTMEGIASEKILITGNTIVDALKWGVSKIEEGYKDENISFLETRLDSKKKLILVTGHRRESFGKGFENICDALADLSLQNVEIVFPVHLNPNVRETVYQRLSANKSIHLIDPVDYPVFLWLMRRCDLIISDSGGIQEEAPSFRKPVLVTRDTSERMEGVDAGFAILVGTHKDKIIKNSLRLLNNPPNFRDLQNPYGYGNASELITNHIQRI